MNKKVVFSLVIFLGLLIIGISSFVFFKKEIVRRELKPQRIVWLSDSTGSYVKNPEALITGKGTLTLKNSSGHKAAILIDFGKEVHGRLSINSGLSGIWKDKDIRVRFGESVTEAMAELGGKTNATNDHSLRDFKLKLPILWRKNTNKSGFRFVRIDLLGEETEATINYLAALTIFRDIPYLGSFKSNDERLNKIWQTGAYTVHLNMQTHLYDGIKRDRLVWIGDMHPEVMTINAVFGYNEVVPKSLDKIKNETPLPKWMNGISSYSLWWIIIQYDWYKNHGDLEYLKEQQSYLQGLVNLIVSGIKNNDENLGEWRFLDWPTNKDPTAIHAGLQSLSILALNSAAEISKALQDDKTRLICQNALQQLIKSKPNHNNTKQAAALMAIAGLMPADKANQEVIAVNGTKGFSTFYGYYMLQAKAKAGDYQGGLDNIREYWGAMLDLGATTFWEDFNMDWVQNAGRIDELVPKNKKDIHADYGDYSYKGLRHSLCHGWATGPTAWLTEHVLGIQVLEPGCKTIKVEPHLGDLQFVEGTFPTPYGVVYVKHKKLNDGTLATEIKAPKEVKIIKQPF